MDTSNSARINGRTRHMKSAQSSLSTAMSQALYEPQDMVRPSPLAVRVKDAGRDFLVHNQTCHWIQHMMEERPPEPKQEQQKKTSPPCQEKEEKAEPEKPKSSPVPVMDIEQMQFLELQEPETSMQYEEQLKLLQIQQQALLEQQQRLQEQVEQQKKAQQLLMQRALEKKLVTQQQQSGETSTAEKEEATAETSQGTTATPANNESLIGPPVRNRRRLKGSVAQTCAIRDEGTIGSLLWQGHCPCFPQAPKAKHSTCNVDSPATYWSPALEGRQAALHQESGMNVSRLLSSWPLVAAQKGEDAEKSLSEYSVTAMTDTITTSKELDQSTNSINNTLSETSHICCLK